MAGSKRRRGGTSMTEAARIGAGQSKANREAMPDYERPTAAALAHAVDDRHAEALYAASAARSAKLSKVLKLREQLAAAEAEMHAASDHLFAVTDEMIRLPRDCEARKSARAIWLHWQYDHATRHGLPVANSLPGDITPA